MKTNILPLLEDVSAPHSTPECDTMELMKVKLTSSTLPSSVPFKQMSRETDLQSSSTIFSLRAGFEPAREDPIGFQVQRLNHSAITACNFASVF